MPPDRRDPERRGTLRHGAGDQDAGRPGHSPYLHHCGARRTQGAAERTLGELEVVLVPGAWRRRASRQNRRIRPPARSRQGRSAARKPAGRFREHPSPPADVSVQLSDSRGDVRCAQARRRCSTAGIDAVLAASFGIVRRRRVGRSERQKRAARARAGQLVRRSLPSQCLRPTTRQSLAPYRIRWKERESDGSDANQPPAAAIGGLSLLGTAATALAASPGEGLFGIGEGLEDFWLATDAYIYGYPLVTMELTRRVMTNVAEPKGNHAPMGQFVRAREVSRRHVPRRHRPQRRHALLDGLARPRQGALGPEPARHEGDRYFLIPMLDGWTNVFQVPGKRTTGDRAQTYAITGPGWTGKLPDGVKEYKSPTGHGLDPRPHLLHRHARGLQGGPRAAGQVPARPAQRLRQAVHAARRARSTRPST